MRFRRDPDRVPLEVRLFLVRRWSVATVALVLGLLAAAQGMAWGAASFTGGHEEYLPDQPVPEWVSWSVGALALAAGVTWLLAVLPFRPDRARPLPPDRPGIGVAAIIVYVVAMFGTALEVGIVSPHSALRWRPLWIAAFLVPLSLGGAWWQQHKGL